MLTCPPAWQPEESWRLVADQPVFAFLEHKWRLQHSLCRTQESVSQLGVSQLSVSSFDWLKKFRVSQAAMTHFYRATIESVLTFSMTVWFGHATSQDKTQLERVVRRASKIIGRSLPSLSSLFSTRIIRKANKIIADNSHPAHYLFNLLPSGRRYRSIKSKTSGFRDSTYPLAIRHLNLHWLVMHLCGNILYVYSTLNWGWGLFPIVSCCLLLCVYGCPCVENIIIIPC